MPELNSQYRSFRCRLHHAREQKPWPIVLTSRRRRRMQSQLPQSGTKERYRNSCPGSSLLPGRPESCRLARKQFLSTGLLGAGSEICRAEYWGGPRHSSLRRFFNTKFRGDQPEVSLLAQSPNAAMVRVRSD